jgi:TonB-linked SusC/RagA family outer membrane protein
MKRLLVNKHWLIFLCLSLLAIQGSAQTSVKVSGIVKDRLDKPIPDVNITVQGKAGIGTTTNEKGEFSITVNTSDILVFTNVNFSEIARPVSNSLFFEIIMDAKQGSQEEVVVVGYGKAKKVSLVGAQSTVNVAELKQPVANISTVLAGRVSGVVGVQRTGLPGENTGDLWIRGISTFGPNATGALVIIDGVQGRDINSLDPEDIASFTILKDASATAVYGVAGANGVILINTKRGKSAKPVLKFNYNQGITGFTKLPELTGAETYMNLTNEARIASGLSAQFSQAYIDSTLKGNQPYLYPNVDWMSTIFKKRGITRRANFSATGGTDNANYYVALAYFDEQSLLQTDGKQGYESDQRFKRYNFTSNLNMNWTRTTKFDLGIQGYITTLNTPGINAQQAFREVMQTTPVLYPVMYPGNLVPGVNAANAQRNPYEQITQTGYINISSNQVYSNAKITQDLGALLPGLSAYALYSFDAFNSQTISRTRQRNTFKINPVTPYNPDGSVNLLPVITNGTDNLNYARNNGGTRSYYLEAAINYDNTFKKDHRVTGLILYNQRSFIDAFAANLTASLPFRSLGIAGRGTYGYKEKYFGEVNFGYNGSENFAPENRFGFFPSVGVGWVVSKEKFFEPLNDIFQFLKIRYSDGYVGSGAGGRRFGFLTIVSDGAAGYTWGNGTNNQASGGGVAITDYGAPVKWSKSRKQDLGIEFKVLDSRLSVIMDFFKEHRTGVFLQRASLPSYVGLNNNPFGNLGVINNSGFDATVETSPFNWGNTKWDFRGTITYNRDMILENDQPAQPFPYMERRGYNVLSTYGYTALGLFADQKEIDNAADQTPLGGTPRPGDIRYKDLNSDGLINNLDISRIGNGDVPNWVYGFGINMSWKNFYAGVFFQGIQGVDRLLNGDGIIPFNNSTGPERSNLFTVTEDRWTPGNPNPNAFYPRLAYGNAANRNNAVASTWWVKDISFIRLKSVALGYNLPQRWVKKAGFRSAQVYGQGFNLFYWSKFKLWDPELNTGNGATYPNTRNFSLGVEFTF